MTADVQLPRDPSTPTNARTIAFVRDVLARVSAAPAVSSAGAIDILPLSGRGGAMQYEVEGRTPPPRGQETVIGTRVVTAGYFRTLDIPLQRGRELNDADVAGGRPVIVLNAAAARQICPEQDCLGTRITWDIDHDGEEVWLEVVGVVADVKDLGLGRRFSPEGYMPFPQAPTRNMTLVVRASDTGAVVRSLPAAIQAVDPEQAVQVRLMDHVVAASIGDRRFVSSLLAAFAAAALLLAALGIFGLVSYSTSQRTREIGLRLALGAGPSHVVRLVMGEGLRLVVAGLGLGAVAAVVLTRLLSDELPVHWQDFPVFLAFAAVLAGTGAVACAAPLSRALRVPPAVALRTE